MSLIPAKGSNDRNSPQSDPELQENVDASEECLLLLQVFCTFTQLGHLFQTSIILTTHESPNRDIFYLFIKKGSYL